MQIIQTEKAPQAIGPYSQAIKTDKFIFCSGQIGLTKEGNLISDSIEDQTKQVLENLKNVLEEAGSALNKVVKSTIFLTDLNDFLIVNKIYGEYMSHRPARATVGVAGLPKGAKVEIECISEI